MANTLLIDDGAQTVTEKRIQPRTNSQASTTSLTPTKVDYDIYKVTALAANITINNPTLNDDETFVIRIKDNGTSRTLTFGTDYEGIDGQALPTATTISKWIELTCTQFASGVVLVSYIEQG